MSDAPIRTRPQPTCPLCGSTGRGLYHDLPDRLYGVAGRWSISACPRPECGSLWQDPTPLEEDVPRLYVTYFTRDGLSPGRPAPPTWMSPRLENAMREGHLFRRLRIEGPFLSLKKKCVSALAALMPDRAAGYEFQLMNLVPRRGARLLDVGCGSGDLMHMLRAAGWDVEGFEPDPRAAERVRARGFTVHADLRLPADRYDAVVLSHVVEHVHDPLDLLVRCRRVLRPGGELSLATPNVESAHHAIFREHWYPLDPPRHLVLFTARSVARLLSRAGFADVRVRSTLHRARHIAYGSRCLRRRVPWRLGDYPPPGLRLWTDWLLARRQIEMRAGRDSGDELAAVARRPAEGA